jgi:hypothetical protein
VGCLALGAAGKHQVCTAGLKSSSELTLIRLLLIVIVII